MESSVLLLVLGSWLLAGLARLLLVLGSVLLGGFARLLVVLGSELFGVRDDLAGLLRYSLVISSTLLRYSKTVALSSFCSK